MDALDCLLGRRTPPRLIDPPPSPAQVETMLEAAVTAPDHKWLRPYRFVVVRSQQRDAVADAIRAAGEAAGLPAGLVAKQAGKATRSPMMIVVIASRRPGVKIPRSEQDATTAAAAQNICLAAYALGFGASWKTVPFSDSDQVRAVFRLTGGEEFLGWVELGTSGGEAGPRPPVRLGDVVSDLVDGSLVPFTA